MRLDIRTIWGWPADVRGVIFNSTWIFALRFLPTFFSAYKEVLHISGDCSSSSLVLILSACGPLAAFDASSAKSRPVPFLSGLTSDFDPGRSAV